MRNILIFVIGSVLPLALFLSFWLSRFPIFSRDMIGTIGYLGAGLYFLYSLVLLMIAILDDEFDLFILTDHRLIDITQNGLVKRTVSATPLDQIQDVSSSVNGILATLLNYGNIYIETSSASSDRFVMDHVPDPSMVARTILNESERWKGKKGLNVGPQLPQNESLEGI